MKLIMLSARPMAVKGSMVLVGRFEPFHYRDARKVYKGDIKQAREKRREKSGHSLVGHTMAS